MVNERTKSDRQTRQDIKENTDDSRATEKSTRQIKQHPHGSKIDHCGIKSNVIQSIARNEPKFGH